MGRGGLARVSWEGAAAEETAAADCGAYSPRRGAGRCARVCLHVAKGSGAALRQCGLCCLGRSTYARDRRCGGGSSRARARAPRAWPLRPGYVMLHMRHASRDVRGPAMATSCIAARLSRPNARRRSHPALARHWRRAGAAPRAAALLGSARAGQTAASCRCVAATTGLSCWVVQARAQTDASLGWARAPADRGQRMDKPARPGTARVPGRGMLPRRAEPGDGRRECGATQRGHRSLVIQTKRRVDHTGGRTGWQWRAGQRAPTNSLTALPLDASTPRCIQHWVYRGSGGGA